MTDRAILFDNEHDRPIKFDCLRGTLFGQSLPADGIMRGVSLFGHADDDPTKTPDKTCGGSYGKVLLDLQGAERLFIPLSPEEIEEIASNIEEDQGEVLSDLGLHADTISAEDFLRIQQRRQKINDSYHPLTAEEIDALATIPDGDQAAMDRVFDELKLDPDTISPRDIDKVNARAREIAERAQAEANNDPRVLPGGVIIPEGFVLAGKVSYDDEEKGIKLTALRPICSFENHTVGVSSTLSRPEYGSPEGIVTLRVIHDGAGVAYLFRQDEGDRTFFRVAFGHGAVT